MKCDHLKGRLFDFCQGKLSKEETTSLNKHLENCSQCNLLLAETKEWFSQSENLKKAEVNPFLADKIISRLKQKETPVKTLSPVLLATFRIAAVLVIGIFSGLLLNNYLQKTTDDSGSASAQNKTEIGADTDETSDQDNLILTFNE
ncbi:MAG: zf-HC2 domain-containing protein [Bacteroidia bacterium]|nr:zf-HC2 domain-containing protein [Bacteroidia bacterium]